MVSAGVVAGLALPSVGTFYALRLQYPQDPFIAGMALASWILIGVSGALVLVGAIVAVVSQVKKRTSKRREWNETSDALAARVAYLQRISDRELAAYVELEVAEQEFRDAHGGKSGGHLENAQRLLKKSEVIDARNNLEAAKRSYLQLAPRRKRAQIISNWKREELNPSE